MLIQAASGLERLMGGSKGNSLKDSTVAQISAYVYYNAHVISRLTTNKQFQSKFSELIFNQIDKDFGQYIDSLARTRPKSLHHVYEWGKTGNKSARLFDLNLGSQDGLSFKISYSFKPSVSFVPASSKFTRRHVFTNKASIMEEGRSLVISPKHSERLVFEADGETVFMPIGKSVTVKRPGGTAARNQFSLAHGRFFSGQLVNNSIKKSGFQQMFNRSMAKALSLPSNIKKVQYSFSPNIIRGQADASLAAAFGGVL
jgi:hypothetical protein